MLTDRRYYIEVLLRGIAVRVTEPPSVSESLDGFGTVAEFNLADFVTPPPTDGDSVRIRRVKLSNGTYQDLFGGYVIGRATNSEPYDMSVRAVDELYKFDAVRTTNDLDLTGMTDKQVWTTIADVCDVIYDPDDICDTGYELGERAAVYWKVDSTGASLIQELDEVLGCKTMTVGNGRVIRFPYELVADEDLASYAYEKGVSNDLRGLKETTASTAQVQSLWRVTSTDFKCGSGDKCSCVVWAKAVDETTLPKKGKKRTLNPKSELSSALIQDEAIAEQVVRRMMRWYNRTPLLLNIQAEMIPSIHPGTIITVIDPTYGIDHPSPEPYFITNVEKQGLDMTITALGGPAGSEGTVTHGVEMQCNKNTGSTDWGGSWTGGGVDVPPWETDGDWFDTGEGSPLLGCTTAGAFQETCEDSTLDDCIPGEGITSETSGPVPDDFCVNYLGGLRLQTKSFTAGGGVPPDDYTATCRIHVPWREVGTGKYHVNESGAVDWVQANGPSTVTLFASGETDPALQDSSNDTLFGVPNIAAIQGTVTFNQAGSSLSIAFGPIESGIFSPVGGASATIYAEPGLSVEPGSSDTTYVYGLSLRTCAQGPIKVGDGLPHMSLGASTRDNGGYVPSSPAPLGTPINFTVYVDESFKTGWGRTVINSDIGGGYIDHLDYLNQAHGPFPGEPASAGTAACAASHEGHKLQLIMTCGGTGSDASPAVLLQNLVLGHSTCSPDEDYEP